MYELDKKIYQLSVECIGLIRSLDKHQGKEACNETLQHAALIYNSFSKANKEEENEDFANGLRFCRKEVETCKSTILQSSIPDSLTEPYTSVTKLFDEVEKSLDDIIKKLKY